MSTFIHVKGDSVAVQAKWDELYAAGMRPYGDVYCYSVGKHYVITCMGGAA